ncbi:hypothetical protein ACFCYH_01720 [Streptomyces sp. NPDC056400]|uniref:hypothetical protein n=1 Tax=Streptomyces sp. NPDC056400 TaxID=3345808 RepID=UPI0035DF8893
MTPTALLGMVDRAAPQKALFWLHQHTQRHPDALTSGSPMLPAAMFRLLTELETHGAEQIVVPPCASCGKRRVLR